MDFGSNGAASKLNGALAHATVAIPTRGARVKFV
jgi:hypothetical protein